MLIKIIGTGICGPDWLSHGIVNLLGCGDGHMVNAENSLLKMEIRALGQDETWKGMEE